MVPGYKVRLPEAEADTATCIFTFGVLRMQNAALGATLTPVCGGADSARGRKSYGFAFGGVRSSHGVAGARARKRGTSGKPVFSTKSKVAVPKLKFWDSLICSFFARRSPVSALLWSRREGSHNRLRSFASGVSLARNSTFGYTAGPERGGRQRRLRLPPFVCGVGECPRIIKGWANPDQA
jgi:hypothetical protein